MASYYVENSEQMTVTRNRYPEDHEPLPQLG